MSIPNNTPKEYKCEICNKNYTTRQNLWKHNHKFHSHVNTHNSTIKPQIEPQNNTKSHNNQDIKCQYCNKILSRADSLKRHIKKCKSIIINNTELKSENIHLKEKVDKMESKMEEMKNMIAELLKTRKIHPKTLQKINNNLTNNINNGTVNNTTIVKFGSVNINSVLTPKEVMGVLLKPFLSTEECINLIHFNDKRPQYNNIFITNLKDDLAYVYDGVKFITVTKNDVIMELIDNYAEQVEISFEEKFKLNL